MRFEVSGDVEVLEDPSEFFRNSLDIGDGNVGFLSVGQWFALGCFL